MYSYQTSLKNNWSCQGLHHYTKPKEMLTDLHGSKLSKSRVTLAVLDTLYQEVQCVRQGLKMLKMTVQGDEGSSHLKCCTTQKYSFPVQTIVFRNVVLGVKIGSMREKQRFTTYGPREDQHFSIIYKAVSAKSAMTQQKWWICKRIRNCMLGLCMLLLRVIPKCSISFSQSRLQFLEH